MKQHIYGTVIFLSLTFPFFSQADTLILKSGRQIEASKCWQETGMIKCKKLGQIIGFPESEVATVIFEKEMTAPDDGFSFDIWKSGLTVTEVIGLAEDHDIPLNKSGIVSINKHFNPKTCLPYANTAIAFDYTTQIFGRQAKMLLQFTPSSKKLYSIRVTWSGSDISKKSEFRDQIEAMLIEKYGRPVKYKEQIIFDRYDYKINKFSTVTMRPGGNYVRLEYLDNRLVQLAKDEKTAKIRKGFTSDDKNKF